MHKDLFRNRDTRQLGNGLYLYYVYFFLVILAVIVFEVTIEIVIHFIVFT